MALIYNVGYRHCYLCGYKHGRNGRRDFYKVFGDRCCEQCYRIINGKNKKKDATKRVLFKSSIFLSVYRVKLEYTYVKKFNHPRADHSNFVLEHVIVIEDYLSKQLGFRVYLDSSWNIHHKNGNRHDNRVENLQLMTHGEHVKYHKKLYELSLKYSELLFGLG
jgi:hypothetical protein